MIVLGQSYLSSVVFLPKIHSTHNFHSKNGRKMDSAAIECWGEYYRSDISPCVRCWNSALHSLLENLFYFNSTISLEYYVPKII